MAPLIRVCFGSRLQKFDRDENSTTCLQGQMPGGGGHLKQCLEF